MRTALALVTLFLLLCCAPVASPAHEVGTHRHVHAVTCSACGGNGVCWPCHGAGKRVDGESCGVCGGNGRCSSCGGRGDH